MPIYEYTCQSCGSQFELLVRSKKAPACPSCNSKQLERMISLPAIKSETTRSKALRAAKKRDANLATDRMHERLNYEQSHDRHG
jgi:putative FmdB family regulatory protein